jgi:hypothetical protein
VDTAHRILFPPTDIHCQQDAVTGKTTNEEGHLKKIQADKEVGEKLGTDRYKREIEVMAKIRPDYTVDTTHRILFPPTDIHCLRNGR